MFLGWLACRTITGVLCVSGRYSSDDICPKRWKANFRCALKSLSDVVELQCCGQTRGKDAFRVYKFLEPAHASKKHGAAAKNYRVSTIYRSLFHLDKEQRT